MQRTTDYLRMHCSSISRRIVKEDEVDNQTFVSLQRERCLRRLQQHDLPDWTSLKASLNDSAELKGISVKEVNDRLREFKNFACDLLGPLSQSSDLVDSTCAFLIQMIYQSYYVNKILGITHEHNAHVSAIFDESKVTSVLLNGVYGHCKFFLSLLQEDENSFAFFFSQGMQSQDPRVEPLEQMMDFPFGFNMHIRTDPFNSPPQSELPVVTWDSNEARVPDKIDSKETAWSLEYKKNGFKEEVEESEEESSEEYIIYDVSWLYESLQVLTPAMQELGLTMEDVMEMIRTNVADQSKSRESVEKELLSFFGETYIEFIRELVDHRGELFESFEDLYGQNTGQQSKGNANIPINFASLLKQKNTNRLPGQSIIVQTETEKKLFKMARKAHKKAVREMKSAKNEKSGKKLTQADIERMKAKKTKELLKAMSEPLFREKERPAEPVYEYVFDSFLEAKNSAAFIAGNKMILPNGFKRLEDKKWEEMTIPAPSKPPAEIISRFKLINVSDLDEVAQVGFAGVERLNQIQSIVYDTAYNSNENMLVCAPTGAGKTNIAMLTILHEIRNNITDDGTLRLNDFKIIYIAPMKALVAEMVENFSRKLKAFGIVVRELTGDMQMTKAEITKTQMIITTPEKWDVITRKASGVGLLQQVKLTIIDEVHLLESDRGSVLEALVARIIRNVESCQQMSRLVGLSATLPNYKDVAEFLSVSLNKGMFVFDNRFRPVPLELCFVGIKALGQAQQIKDMDDVLYDKVRDLVIEGHQVMVFVHSRNATSKTAINLLEEAGRRGESKLFMIDDYDGTTSRATRNARHKMLHELMPNGFAIHHAGLLRPDRNIVEKLFRDGGIKVLCCTATLAWGVNLPAHAVVIRGTDIYDPNHGGFIDISMLDVMQIFGRAGRPQYDTSGFACIITAHEKLAHYLSMLTCQFPIESKFLKYITDNLNAEIVAGTVADVTEGCFWLGYTYLFVRMKKNPLAYGMCYEDLNRDPYLQAKKRELIIMSARELHAARMIVFDEDKETFTSTDLGRTASHFYIKYDTIVTFNEKIQEDMMEDRLLQMLCSAQEFDQLKSREEEMEELFFLLNHSCKLLVNEIPESREGKVNILLQSCLSRTRLDSFSLSSDAAYVQQNIVRLVRGLFEYSRKCKWAALAHKTLLLSKMLDKRMWNFQTPFLQFSKRELDDETLHRLDQNSHLTPTRIKTDPEMTPDVIGRIVRNHAKGKVIKELANYFPLLDILVRTTVLNQFDTLFQLLVEIEYTPDFTWNDFYHGKVQGFWMWIYDLDTYEILHYEYVILSKLQVKEKKAVNISFRMAVNNSVTRMVLHVDSDYWLGCDRNQPITLGLESEDNKDTNYEPYLLTAFKEQQDTRDPTANIRMHERVRDRETKEDRAHLYPKSGNSRGGASGSSFGNNQRQSGNNRGRGGSRNSGSRGRR